MGPKTLELEEAFCEYTGSEHAVAVSSATAALHMACLAAGVGPGDEVIAPALSFVADAHAGRIAGGETVLADCVSPAEPLMDPAHVESLVTERTKAIIAVHMFGYPADIDALRSIAEKRGIALIEDCAESDGGKLRDGSCAGTAGVCGCFSFFSKTQLGVGEGGIMVTDSEEFAAELRKLRSHAMTSVTWDRHRGHAETYDVTRLGFNFRIDEPRATLAMARLGTARRGAWRVAAGRSLLSRAARRGGGRRGPVPGRMGGAQRPLRVPRARRRPRNPRLRSRVDACPARADDVLPLAHPALGLRAQAARGRAAEGRGVRRSALRFAPIARRWTTRRSTRS